MNEQERVEYAEKRFAMAAASGQSIGAALGCMFWVVLFGALIMLVAG